MSAEAHSTGIGLNNRQWQGSRSTLSNRSPSLLLPSTNPSILSDSVYLHPQYLQKQTNSAYTLSTGDSLRPKSPLELDYQSTSSSSGSSLQECYPESEDYQLFHCRVRTQTVTPASVRRALQPDFDRMRIPFPGSNQRDSASSTDSRPSCSSSDSASAYDDDLGGIPARHALLNRANTKACSDGDASTKCLRDHSHTSGSPSSVSSFTSPRSSTSLRLKAKKSHSHRAAMTLFKSMASSPAPEYSVKPLDIEFDWAEQRRQELERRAILLERETRETRPATDTSTQAEPEVPSSTEHGDDETQDRTSLRPRSWELTPEELSLRDCQRREDARKFIFKDQVWVNRSYVSAHSRDAVPYPLAYDAVNIQTDRHSHALVKQLLCSRPSIHDDPSKKPPAVVLDLGCGDGTWILEAAQCWRNTRFYGLDLQSLHPSPPQLQTKFGDLVHNLKFTYYNFLHDKLPYLDEKFDLVRMANLKWAIPEDKWDFVLQEVNRVLRRGGWVEIIDDDFLLCPAPQDMLSREQRVACEILEIQFMDMLKARNLLLNTGGQFMNEKLSQWFNAFHEDNFPIAISRAIPVSLDIHGQSPVQVLIPSEGVSQKAAKLMGFGLDSAYETHRPVGSTKSRSRSGSVSSGMSYSSGVSCSSGQDSVRLDDRNDDQHGNEATKQRTYQPFGLDVHPGRFIPFPPLEVNAHATRNMQSILASKEAIRAHKLKKCAELEALEVKEELLLDEKQRFDELSSDWKDRQRAFDDLFWDFETAMLRRLNLPEPGIEDDDNAHHHNSVNLAPRPHPNRTTSGLHKSHKIGDGLLSPLASTFSTNSHVPVRLIRVYSGWK